MKNLFIFCAVFSALSLYAEAQKAIVTASVLNVRVKASAKSDTLTQLKRGAEVVVLERGAEWTAIRPPEKSSLYVSSPLIADGKLKSNGNLRAGSGVNFQSLCILPAGTPVKVLEEKNSWSRIAVPAVDVRCYVVSRYLKFEESPAAKVTEKTPSETPAVKPVKKGDIVSFSTASRKNISKLYIKGTEKNITVKGELVEADSKEYGKTYGLRTNDREYHLLGVIPNDIDISKPVVVKGISKMVRNWKIPVIEVESISQK